MQSFVKRPRGAFRVTGERNQVMQYTPRAHTTSHEFYIMSKGSPNHADELLQFAENVLMAS